MQTLEIFSGTESFSKVAKERGHATFTVDDDPQFNPTWSGDVRRMVGNAHLPEKIDVLWASPPCQGFSVAVIGRNWNHDYTPKTDSARLAMELVQTTLNVIDELKPRWFFIENPRAMLRKLPHLKHLRMVTVTYCQYGDTRMKPTDIWTNVPPEMWTPRPHCKNGDKCHEAAPRGSRTGTQGIKGARDRGAIPPAIFHEILENLERNV